MTNTPDQPNRLDLIEAILVRVAAQQEVNIQAIAANSAAIAGLSVKQEANTEAMAALTQKLDNLSEQVTELTQNANRVLARSAVLDDVLLELRDSHEQHQHNFEEHQRTTNAALQSLEAILLQLLRIFPQQ
ncbi:MAG: hypothetical protein RMY28_013000 [Nostoc sp. ChiSLP01]|nr:hypothetical protein [Nostoc sp. CmiSLP01]MDZ8285674.1 hypothetical protein [Nostoc sp. ChiSLP01]